MRKFALATAAVAALALSAPAFTAPAFAQDVKVKIKSGERHGDRGRHEGWRAPWGWSRRWRESSQKHGLAQK